MSDKPPGRPNRALRDGRAAAPEAGSPARRPSVSTVLAGLAVVLLVLTVGFARGFWGAPERGKSNPLVDLEFTKPTTIRTSYVQLVSLKADLSDFDCYGCHETNKPPKLRFDANKNLIVPKEHNDIVMAHGRHGRNNNCFNCHNEQNLLLLQASDRRELKMEDSPALCGSCHGPTYRDWEAGVHGRTFGQWKSAAAEPSRLLCVDCHDPHHPKIPSRKPAPGPNPLRPAHRAEVTAAH
jgi:hypothetical protein